jgi:Bacterial Ig domain
LISGSVPERALRVAFILSLLVFGFAVVPASAQASSPAVISSRGYIEGAPLTTHTMATFDSRRATTLIAFVSTHPTWNGQPVSIAGVSDGPGNTWSVLTGPSAYSGSSFSLQSVIYYVTAPITSPTHTVIVSLTNPAPLVVHVFAVSGTDVTGVPTYSAISDPGTGVTSSDVISAPITAPANSMLLSWAKNDANGTAVPLDGFSLDAQSSSFLWAESQVAAVAGSFRGHFSFDRPVGWQAAIVALPAPVGPVAFNETVATDQNMPAAFALQAQSPNDFPLVYTVLTGPTRGTLTGVAPDLAYSPNPSYTGGDSLTYKANDGTGDSNIATVTITVRGPNSPPVAGDSNVTVMGSSGAVTLTASDADGDPLIYTIVTPPAHGQLSSGTGSTRIYTPNAGYLGSDSFTFKVNDGHVDSNLALVNIAVQAVAAPPTVVSSRGYLNSAPLASHTTTAFDTRGASTLVAFVSTHPTWGGRPVSINNVVDNAGNTWTVLTGPTSFAGGEFDLLSAVYYVTAPITSATSTLTVNLTNPSPTVMHVFAVAGTDVASPLIYSPITDPGVGWTSFDATSAPVTVPTNTLLLSWVKNVSDATAVALGGFTLDPQSVNFLWAEFQPALIAGAYTGQFQYGNAIGWQTAIVGLKPPAGLVAFDQTVRINHDTAVDLTLEALSSSGSPITYSVLAGPTHGNLTGVAPNLTYAPNAAYVGSDAFTFKANDGTADSNTATVSITVRATNHTPVAYDSAVAAASSIAFTLNASDADCDPLSYIVVTPPAHGRLAGSGANRVYTPPAHYIGSDSFTFKVNDGQADSNIAVVSVTVHETPLLPVVVSSAGYLNGTPLNSHTTTTFDSRAASTLVAFVSTNAVWSGLPVSIASVSDNAGNAWRALTGPATYPGDSFTLLSGVYYVTAPVTSAAHTVTVRLSNGAPLVAHVFAVAGTDLTAAPVYTPIADPGDAFTSPEAITAPLAVPANTMLLAWVRNEGNATANTADGYAMDPQSSSFLWAESQLASASGTFAGHFVFDASIGWQAALVGLTPIPSLNPMAVTVLSPNGGNRVFAGVPTTVGWSHTGTPVSFDVAVSIDNGVTFAPIPTCTNLSASAGSCIWTPSATPSVGASIMVTARDGNGGTVTDRSDSVFTIAVPSITVSAPGAGASWTAGTIRSITWSHNLGPSSSVRLELSRNGGSTWEILAPSIQNLTETSGSYSLPIATPATSNGLVKVTWLNGPASGSSAAFSIVAPAIMMVAPTASDTWQAGASRTITFMHNLGADQLLNIEASHDDGLTWSSVGTVVTTSSTTASYSWIVSGPPTSVAHVRVSWIGSGFFASSDGRFTISSSITITAPSTPVTWAIGSIHTISWTQTLGVSDTVDVSFSPDGGLTWMPIALGIASTSATTGSYRGTMPTIATATGVIRVSSSSDPAESDVSHQFVTLAGPALCPPQSLRCQ